MVDIRVDLATLAGLDDRSAEIPGLGPVIADIARQVAATHPRAEWRFGVTDEHGHVVCAGITRRRPDAAHLRLLQAIHPTCVFPGCRMPAVDCDIDHNTPWSEGGPTTIENTTPKCRHDHDLRHRGGWRYRYQNGRHIWTSPLGHIYVTRCRSPSR